MILRLLPLFIFVPVLELYLIILLGQRAGFFNTFLFIVFAGIVGIFLVKQQGLETLRRLRSSIAQGQVPGNEVLDGCLILIGSALLLTPGILTDIGGFTLLVPWTRRFWRESLKVRVYSWIKNGKIKILY
ncbi:MAG: FxsA family protein [Desulfitobacteriaceae bacterium]|nr:FxsA family protein [Desulfitobacteriaceae bacterium]MDD4752042.1 FxsA family protein [Desulfitobacteriaceae bacterium]